MNLNEYYKNEDVIARLMEYCGGAPPDPRTLHCLYLVGYGNRNIEKYGQPHRAVWRNKFYEILDDKLDIFRSIWSDNATLAVLDIEYFHKEFAGDIYLNPKGNFSKLEPIYNLVKGIYGEYDIDYITIMTGQGYHFVSLIPFEDEVHKRIESLAKVEESLLGKYDTLARRRKRKVPLHAAKGYTGMGRLMEFIAHSIILRAGFQKDYNPKIPISISDIASKGKEGISLDLTMYGDTMFMRDLRLPFSSHQKHRVDTHKTGEEIARKIPVQLAIPRRARSHNGEIIETSLDKLLGIRRSFHHSAELAKQTRTYIPDASEGFNNLLKSYASSRLFKFHREFDASEHEHFTNWHKTYHQFPLPSDLVPECVRFPLQNPNPELLKPTNLQTVCRFLYSIGWHPKHIAGLIRSRYETNFNNADWGEEWKKYDACARANFWARAYCGLIFTGVDKLVDFNCVSQQEKGYCPRQMCGVNLEENKDSLLRAVAPTFFAKPLTI